MSLTPKQQLFVEQYLVDLNATAAAKRAGYSERTAYAIGRENVQKPEIAAAIQAAMTERSKRTEITMDMVVRELAKVAFTDPRRYMSWGGRGGAKLRPSSELTDDDAAAVAEVSKVGRNVKFKLHDKVGALKVLKEHLGGIRHQVELTGKGGEPIAHTHTNVTKEELAEAIRGVREKF